MVSVGEIYDYIDSFAPFRSAMSFDNPGLLVGNGKAGVSSAVLSLDITPAVVQEAHELGAELIVSHHPVIFHPLKSLSADSAPYLLAQYGIAAICAHTNLDMAAGGVNTCLAERLRLRNVRTLREYEDSGLPEALEGETGCEYTPEAFARFVKEALGCDGLRFTDGKRTITRVGLCSGGGADLVYDAAQAGCQAFVTGESKHNILLDAENMGVTLVDAGHFCTENPVILPLAVKLKIQFPDVAFFESKRMHSPAKYL
ncbi:MAG: Nif3-like dinuclear metal center hexameric protein [Ruminococcaceae bacterium]|jgi:dinuclear metal center protein, YbgI/SA1388 family|nr:Nif3-like dinuclear metal center hexameric protein [Oscillospiraceae bacterium]